MGLGSRLTGSRKREERKKKEEEARLAMMQQLQVRGFSLWAAHVQALTDANARLGSQLQSLEKAQQLKDEQLQAQLGVCCALCHGS